MSGKLSRLMPLHVQASSTAHLRLTYPGTRVLWGTAWGREGRRPSKSATGYLYEAKSAGSVSQCTTVILNEKFGAELWEAGYCDAVERAADESSSDGFGMATYSPISRAPGKLISQGQIWGRR